MYIDNFVPWDMKRVLQEAYEYEHSLQVTETNFNVLPHKYCHLGPWRANKKSCVVEKKERFNKATAYIW